MLNEARIKVHKLLMGRDPVKKFVNPYTNLESGKPVTAAKVAVPKKRINIREFALDCKDTLLVDIVAFFTPKHVIRKKLAERSENNAKYEHFVELAYGRRE
jgi:hypothetical protein